MNILEKNECEDLIIELSGYDLQNVHEFIPSYMENDREKLELRNCYDKPLKMYCLVVGAKNEATGEEWGMKIQHPKQMPTRIGTVRYGPPQPEMWGTAVPVHESARFSGGVSYTNNGMMPSDAMEPGATIPTNDLNYNPHGFGIEST